MSVFVPAFLFSLSLIAAIGAQNAFVLRQGLRREHVLPVVLICAGSDAVLIGAGVAGFGTLVAAAPLLAEWVRYGGAAFLVAYGARAFFMAWRGGNALAAADGAGGRPLVSTLMICAALTWLNPHVYLDTVVLMGTVSARYPGQGVLFWLGAASASFVFFFSLGYGARLAAPVFARPASWRWLDAGIGIVMWALALMLMRG